MHYKGHTLIELLAVLTILTIVMAAAVPSLTSIIEQNQSVAEVNRLVGAVNLTRNTAVTHNTMATLCGIKSTGKCGARWKDRLTVFLDRNQNARLDQDEITISYVQSFNSDSIIKWRSFQNRQYLQMTAMGYTNYQNGNFVVCPASANPKQAKQLVVNVQGRVRMNHSVNEEGLPVDRKGRILRC